MFVRLNLGSLAASRATLWSAAARPSLAARGLACFSSTRTAGCSLLQQQQQPRRWSTFSGQVASFSSTSEHQQDLDRIKELEKELEGLQGSIHDIDPQPDNFFIDNLPWNSNSKRVGVIGKKMGMLSVWDQHGTQFPVTVIAVPDCQVLNANLTPDKMGRVGLQVAADNMKPKNATKALLTVFRKAKMPPKRRVVEFRVTPDAVLPPGFPIDVRHFLPGQYVDIQGRTIGKGFQGGMKRWGFGGQSASHGASLSHRSLGSTGACQDPGKVFKGKKMAGHMGNRLRTQQSMRVFRVDPIRKLILIYGSIPGKPGNLVVVKDSFRKPFKLDSPPPFPTFVAEANEDRSQLNPHDPKFSVDQSNPETFWPVSRGGMAV